jgi:DNA repair protein RecN (Recombination protein N)
MRLLELAVRDLALIENVRVSFPAGFSVITGETGAGKSLLIDALTLVLGGRADTGLVRHGAETARVEALFDGVPEPLICVREVGAGGRSVARIDDETVTAGRLAAVVGPLVEIHGQHEQQRLLSAAWQRDILDTFGGHEALREDVGQSVGAWRANEAALRELAVDPAELQRRLELAQHAADEIETANPQPGEVDALKARLSTAANSQRIKALARDLADSLGSEGGSRDSLAIAARTANELARLDPAQEALAERLNGLAAEADDLALDLRRLTAALADELTDVSAIEERLGLLYGLLRKYGGDEQQVLAHAADARAEAERLATFETERKRRSADAELLEQAAREAASLLTQARRDTAGGLSAAVTDALLGLGFPRAAFAVDLAPSELDASGADDIAFLLAPNPGEPARPLARIASGGEMSRVALAIKGVLARADDTPTLVFDEVDAGIGGRSADPVGRSLWQLARSHQVICVTHLPQIAAYADTHLRISKGVRGERTVTEIEQLDDDARLAELAQMLGGSGSDDGARAAAAELLARAERTRSETSAVGA